MERKYIPCLTLLSHEYAALQQGMSIEVIVPLNKTEEGDTIRASSYEDLNNHINVRITGVERLRWGNALPEFTFTKMTPAGLRRFVVKGQRFTAQQIALGVTDTMRHVRLEKIYGTDAVTVQPQEHIANAHVPLQAMSKKRKLAELAFSLWVQLSRLKETVTSLLP